MCNKAVQTEVKVDAHSRLQAYSTVGTFNYTAVEVLRGRGYTEKCDFWSAGCILYECLFGYPPFAARTPSETRKKILDYQKWFKIPENKVSKLCEDFLNRLLCEPEQRMCFEEIVKHEFMKGIDFKKLYEYKTPFIPKLASQFDT